jgi:hypothetical protein
MFPSLLRSLKQWRHLNTGALFADTKAPRLPLPPSISYPMVVSQITRSIIRFTGRPIAHHLGMRHGMSFGTMKMILKSLRSITVSRFVPTISISNSSGVGSAWSEMQRDLMSDIRTKFDIWKSRPETFIHLVAFLQQFMLTEFSPVRRVFL